MTAAPRRSGRYLTALFPPLAVLLADVLFLVMFLAAAPIERLSDSGLVVAPAKESAAGLAYAYAAQWRHGMAANSPLYMPGFFAAAVALWFWSMGKTLRRIIIEGAALLAAALAVATVIATPFAEAAVRGFQENTGCSVSGRLDSSLALASFQGTYTLITWSSFVIGSRLAIQHRSIRPLGIAAGATAILALVRPWTVDEFGSYWWRRTLDGDPIAVISAALVFVLAGALAVSELARERHTRGSRSQESGRKGDNSLW